MTDHYPTLPQEQREECLLEVLVNPEVENEELDIAFQEAIEHAGLEAVKKFMTEFLKDLAKTPYTTIEARMMGLQPEALGNPNIEAARKVLDALIDASDDGTTDLQSYLWKKPTLDPIHDLWRLEGLGMYSRPSVYDDTISRAPHVYRAPGRNLTNH